MKTFRALLVEKSADQTFSRRIATRSLSELPAHPVLVRVCYSSLNYKDGLSAIGNRGVTRRYPHTPGIDAAGVVEEDSSASFRPGQEVIVSCYDLGMNTPGGFGEYIRVPPEWVLPCPAGLSLKESMIYGTAGFTAAQSVDRLVSHGLEPGDGKVLVTGATGGVGSMAVAILSTLGYRVAAVTGKPQAEAFLNRLGAAAILTREQAADGSGRALLREKWAGVVDTVGGVPLSTAIRATRYNGLVTCCGNVASAELALTVYPFILRGVTLAGIDSAKCPRRVRERLWPVLAGPWKPPLLEKMTTVISLEELDHHLGLILQGREQGRVVVDLER